MALFIKKNKIKYNEKNKIDVQTWCGDGPSTCLKREKWEFWIRPKGSKNTFEIKTWNVECENY